MGHHLSAVYPVPLTSKNPSAPPPPEAGRHMARWWLRRNCTTGHIGYTANVVRNLPAGRQVSVWGIFLIGIKWALFLREN